MMKNIRNQQLVNQKECEIMATNSDDQRKLKPRPTGERQ